MLRQGDIYWAQLPKIKNTSIQFGFRPLLIVSNNVCNKYSNVIHCIPLTSKQRKRYLPTHVTVSGYGLTETCVALAEQLMIVDKRALKVKIGTIEGTEVFRKIQDAIKVQLAV